MNHYERLKVSQDAPPEVIRAAYRALATKLHPDRQGADTGPQHAMHEQMAALNTAYEVLIDPKLRQDYDATLAPAHARTPVADASAYGVAAMPGYQARVDMDWLPTKPDKAQMFWPPSRPLAMVGGGVLALLVVSAGGALWRMSSQQQMEQALSDQYVRGADQPGAQAAVDARAPASPVPAAGARQVAVIRSGTEPAAAGARRRPTVDELARMSDEELMRVLPTLDSEGDTPKPVVQASRSTERANVHHPLDGKPISLRVDTQIMEPLAAPTKVKSKP